MGGVGPARMYERVEIWQDAVQTVTLLSAVLMLLQPAKSINVHMEDNATGEMVIEQIHALRRIFGQSLCCRIQVRHDPQEKQRRRLERIISLLPAHEKNVVFVDE
jgi:hypothetical protein